MFEVDDDDFTPNSNSNLFSIFNTQPSEDIASLSYKAPKQPKPTEIKPTDSPVVKNESSVILANVVNLWKLENGDSKLQGKHIAAIIGKQNQMELLVYKEKTNILIRETLNDAISFFKYSNNFIGFYDRNRSFWNLSLLTVKDYDEFLAELSKQNCVVVSKISENGNKENAIETSKEESVVERNTTDTDEVKQKNDILSRITKMGQAILPKNIVEKKRNTSHSDSETESSQSDTKPTVTPRKFKKSHGVIQEKKILTPLTRENELMLRTELPNNNQMMFYPQGMFLSQPMPEYNMNNYLFAQNAELKNNIAEINMKLSSMLSNQNSGQNPNAEEFKEAKSRIKCLNLKLENITTELNQLKKRHLELKETYNNKCKELTEEKEKNIDVDFLKNNLNDKEKGIEQLKIVLNEKDQYIEKQKNHLTILETCQKDCETNNAVASKKIDELQKKLNDTQLKLKQYEDSCKEQQKLLDNSSQNTPINDSSKIIKETMNEAFTSIMSSFDENQRYNYEYIQKVILTNLKHSSLNLITKFNGTK